MLSTKNTLQVLPVFFAIQWQTSLFSRGQSPNFYFFPIVQPGIAQNVDQNSFFVLNCCLILTTFNLRKLSEENIRTEHYERDDRSVTAGQGRVNCRY